MKLKESVRTPNGKQVDIISIPSCTKDFNLINKISFEGADADGIEYPSMNKTAYYADGIAFEKHDFCVYVWEKA